LFPKGGLKTLSGETVIMDKLVSQILSGEYRAHEKLPSENEIADRYKVPRMTARKAYEKLEELGYIYKKQGKGSYAQDRRRQIELVLSGDVSFSQKMTEKGYDFHSENIFCEKIKYDKEIYDFLEAPPEERVFKVGRLRFIDRQPIAIHISYVAKSLFRDIDQEGARITSMFKYYNSKGYEQFCSKPSILSVSFPTESQRELLGCTYLIPLLVLESGCIDQRSGRVLDYTRIFYRSDRFFFCVNHG